MGSFVLHRDRVETECLPKLTYQGQTPLQKLNTIISPTSVIAFLWFPNAKHIPFRFHGDSNLTRQP